jgi:phosphoglycolate phosphatase
MSRRAPEAAVLFDLDGVLADSRETITRSMQAGFVAEGHPEPSDEAVLAIIGPPSRIGIGQLLGADPESPVVEACVTAYRDRYATALLRTPSFPGVPEAVRTLRAQFRLGVATSKPAHYAEPVLEAIGLRGAFDVVAGPPLTGTEGKSPVVARALAQLPGAVAMVGDRKPDMLAAREHGLLAIGVTWGFGSVEELTGAGAQVLVDQPDELVGVLRDAATRARFETNSCTTGP